MQCGYVQFCPPCSSECMCNLMISSLIMTVQTIIDLQQSVSVVLTGESAVDIMTEADSNDVTEKLSTGMSGFSFAGGLP